MKNVKKLVSDSKQSETNFYSDEYYIEHSNK